MLPKNTFKKLEDFLKKHEILWLSEEQPEYDSGPKPLGGSKPSGDYHNMKPLTDFIVRPTRDTPSSDATEDVSLEAFLKHKQIFTDILMDAFGGFDRKKGKEHKWSEIYKKGCIKKQIFSKIFHNKLPTKDNVIMFAFAIEATLQEAEELLKSAGFFLGDCITRDLIFIFCFENRITDISEVNELLKLHKEKPLWRKYNKKKTMKLTSYE